MKKYSSCLKRKLFHECSLNLLALFLMRRSHRCELCGATGDDAHTRNYCPKLTREDKMRRALPKVLNSTARQATGVRGTAVRSSY